MPYAIVGTIIAICVYLPQLWVRYVMRKHKKELSEIPGTGGELAQHLLNRFELDGFVVEQSTKLGDHFDPSAKAVRLSPENFSGKSLTAVAVAAHEVGHALQFHKGEKIFQLRSKYIPRAAALKRLGVFLMVLFPFIGFLLKSPILIFMVIAASLILQLLGALSYLIVLPEEWDASFNKALPILIDGDYIDEKHQKAVHSVLKAAALTYFAAALADILNIGRWVLILLKR